MPRSSAARLPSDVRDARGKGTIGAADRILSLLGGWAGRDGRPAHVPVPPHLFVTPRAARELRRFERKRAADGRRYGLHLMASGPDSYTLQIHVVPDRRWEARLAPAVCDVLPAYLDPPLARHVLAAVVDYFPPDGIADEAERLGLGLTTAAVAVPDSYATNPGCLRYSFEKLRRFHPELLEGPPTRERMDRLAELAYHLLVGDACAAVVVSVRPQLLVAAYSGDMDCAVPLKFPPALADEHRLARGDRLVTVNTYTRGGGAAADLDPGPGHTGVYGNFHPMIAEFLCDDPARVAHLKSRIAGAEWARAHALADGLARSKRIYPRSGKPLETRIPAL